MIKYEPIFTWDEETKTASCLLEEGGKTFIGMAHCHPEDEDFASEKTGCEIAFMRAKIKVLKNIRDELKISLKTLKDLYHSMNMSHRFNEKSYENKMLQRKTREINFDLDTTKEIIATEEQKLREYIEKKENFYKKTRLRRWAKEQVKDNNN